VASARIRPATGAHDGVITDSPAMPGIRRPSASRFAALIIILDGTQPQYGHSPPTSRDSTPATASPASASLRDVLAAGTQADHHHVEYLLTHAR